MDLKAAFRGDLVSWWGLAADTQVVDVEAALETWRQKQEEQREREPSRFNVTLYERSDAPMIVEVWFRYGEKNIALIEIDDPIVNDLDQILKTFGEPDLLQENQRLVGNSAIREHIYLSRGINLSISESPTHEKKVVHVQLFTPTTRQFYITDIGTLPDLRPYPKE